MNHLPADNSHEMSFLIWFLRQQQTSKTVLLLWILNVFYVLCLLCLCMRLFICALWSPAGKGLTSWLSFVVSYCEFVTFPLLSWVRCGTWLYQFLIFAPLLTLKVLSFLWTFEYSQLYYRVRNVYTASTMKECGLSTQTTKEAWIRDKVICCGIYVTVKTTQHRDWYLWSMTRQK